MLSAALCAAQHQQNWLPESLRSQEVWGHSWVAECLAMQPQFACSSEMLSDGVKGTSHHLQSRVLVLIPSNSKTKPTKQKPCQNKYMLALVVHD